MLARVQGQGWLGANGLAGLMPRDEHTNDGDIVLGGLELPESDIDGDTTLTLGLELVKNPRILEGALAELSSLLLWLSVLIIWNRGVEMVCAGKVGLVQFQISNLPLCAPPPPRRARGENWPPEAEMKYEQHQKCDDDDVGDN